MRLIRLGLGNVSPKVGAFMDNAKQILAQARVAMKNNCHVFACGELSLCGYPCEDRVQWSDFIRDQADALHWLCCELRSLNQNSSMVTIVGLIIGKEGQLYNCAAVIAEGVVVGLVPKENLPDYNVFYEGRTMTPGYPNMFQTMRRLYQTERSEDGYIETPIGDMIFQFRFGKLAVEICEDIWRADGPMVRRAYAGADLIVNLSASPFRIGVRNTRRELVCTRASDNNAVVAYVNLVGGQDNLVFDGGAYVSSCGQLMHEAEYGKAQVTTCVVNLDHASRMRTQNTTWRRSMQAWAKEYNTPARPYPIVSTEITRACGMNKGPIAYPVPLNKNFFLPISDAELSDFFYQLREMIILGLNDYMKKSGAFDRILVALSGGFDSCLTALLAHNALRMQANEHNFTNAEREAFMTDKLWLVNMPSKHNSDATKSISQNLATALYATYKVSSIQDAYELECASVQNLTGKTTLDRITKQNIQARIRGERMQNLANDVRGMWLQTSNMSEKAVGYTTVGGDMMGALSLIANLPKTVVIEFVRWYAHDSGFQVLNTLLESKASAELEDNQQDEVDLMPFPILDACLYLFVNEKLTLREVRNIIRTMWTDDELSAMSKSYEPGKITEWVKLFGKLFFRNIHKWVQCPLSIHLGSLDLDRERALQLPIIQEADIDEMLGDEQI